MTPDGRKIFAGLPYPLGATYDARGVNFALYSAHATRVELCLFDARGREERLTLPHYTDGVFHGYVKGLPLGQLYGYRVHGPFHPEKGHRFNPHKLLIDPYARQLTAPIIARNTMLGYKVHSPNKDLSYSEEDSAPDVPKCVVADDAASAASAEKPRRLWRSQIIYEAHLKGFTARHPEVDKALRGTFAGMAAPRVIQYLKGLGITSVELLPVSAFMTGGFLLEKGLTNYWGYDSIAFMAPHASYLAKGGLDEMKHMVRVFHEANIEVILDVVFNHTGEGNELGQTLCYRGIDNAVYYRLNKDNPRYYDDTTGCGNSFNLSHPRVLQLVMDALRYWANVVDVDAFRFDLATTLARDDNAQYSINSDFLTTVQQDPTLQRMRLIAEPWDLGNEGYQVGAFRPGWAEWNDKFRDTVRRFWKGDMGVAGDFANRLMGSADFYQAHGRKPWASINFVTAHDGFTLNDLVSYNEKRNAANHEDNRDGSDNNNSWNNGVEGATDNPEILRNRMLRARGMMASLLLSVSTPMLQAGDEFLRTQGGNNNTYAQDNEISWIDWNLTPQGRDMLDFTKKLIALRKKYAFLAAENFFSADAARWYRPDGRLMKPDDWQAYVRALSFLLSAEGTRLFFIFNAYSKEIAWKLPSGYRWKLVLDSSESIKPAPPVRAVSAPAWSVLVFEHAAAS